MGELIADTWSPPTHFDGFEIRGLLGQGGMGRVYLAYEAGLDRLVAVKFILRQDKSSSARERFSLEARAVARLAHANVVTVHRIGEVGGQPYVAYEYVAGRSLVEFTRPAAWFDVLRVALGVARALSAAHSKGVLHRDVKPANILESEARELKLVDFGLAKFHAADGVVPSSRRRTAHDDHATAATLPHPALSEQVFDASSLWLTTVNLQQTATGVLVGTPLYVAPEVWLGGVATPASDVFALGLVLYELAVGKLPHGHLTSREIAEHVVHNDLPNVRDSRPDFPQAVAKVIERALARNPEQRFGSGVELCEALESLHNVLSGFRSLAPPANVETSESGDAASLVSASLSRLSSHTEALYSDVYERMFESHPALRPLFPLDMTGQRSKLASALQLVIENLRNPEYVVTVLEELGERHLAYGVSPEHLELLGDVLLPSLERHDPLPWNESTREAWRSAYAAIAHGMRRGFRSATLNKRLSQTG